MIMVNTSIVNELIFERFSLTPAQRRDLVDASHGPKLGV